MLDFIACVFTSRRQIRLRKHRTCEQSATTTFLGLMAAEAGAPAAKRARSDEGAKGADAVADSEVFPPPARVTDGAHIVGLDEYRREYAKSVADPTAFWAEKAKRYITWWRLPAGIARGSFEVGDIEWFSGKIFDVARHAVGILRDRGRCGTTFSERSHYFPVLCSCLCRCIAKCVL